MTQPRSTPPSSRVGLHNGRINQKRRTQQALLDAALSLRDAGKPLDMAAVAELAMVSKATAYRYFNSPEALLAMAHFERQVPLLDTFFRPGDDPARALGRAAREINALLAADERALHQLELSSMHLWLEARDDDPPPRPGRRLRLIDPVLVTLAPTLGAAATTRLRTALAMLMGTEAVIAARDVAGATMPDTLAAAEWAVEVLVREALAEAAAAAGSLRPT
jgi:AcrR family transcriptional regulator